MSADAARVGSTELAERLRVRTLVVGVATGIVVFAGLYPVAHDAPTLSHGLRTTASPLLALAAGADATLVGLLIVVGLAGAVVLPALAYLFRLTQRWNRA